MSPSHAHTLLAHSLVIGLTGHRHLPEANIPALQAAVRRFFADMQARYPELPMVLLSPLAEGSDQLVTQVALELGLRVIAPLPLPLELYRDDFEHPQDLERLDAQLAQVEWLELPLARGMTRASVEVRGPSRDRQYAQAGIFVSRHCHVLLALWDGDESEQVGGTAHVVRFHLQGTQRDDVERRHAAATLLGPDKENIVYHILTTRGLTTRDLTTHDLTNRDVANGHVAASPAEPEGRWLTDDVDVDDETMEACATLPQVFAQMFERQVDFSVDVRKYAAQIAAQPDVSSAAAACPVWRAFRAVDWLARSYQRRVARVLLTTYVLVALMGFTFFAYTDLMSNDVVIYGFLLFFMTGMGVTAIASRRAWQRKYLDYRTLAEGLRVQSYWRRAGIVTTGTSAFAQDNFLQKQDVELGWIRNVMRGASLDGMLAPAASDAADVDAVIREWIGAPGSGGQLAYYTDASKRRSLLHHRAERLGRICIGLGVALSVLLALMARQFDAQLKQALVSVMGFLSVAAAVHEAYVHKKADKELIRQYRFMQRIFVSAQRMLDGGAGLEERKRILFALGEAALTEHAEWTLMHRERPLPRSRI